MSTIEVVLCNPVRTPIRPLPGATRLADAPFWTPAQARFLGEEIAEDADWAEIVDRLDVALRAS